MVQRGIIEVEKFNDIRIHISHVLEFQYPAEKASHVVHLLNFGYWFPELDAGMLVYLSGFLNSLTRKLHCTTHYWSSACFVLD